MQVMMTTTTDTAPRALSITEMRQAAGGLTLIHLIGPHGEVITMGPSGPKPK